MTSRDVSPSAVSGLAGRIGVVVVNFGSHLLVQRNFGWLERHAEASVIIADNFKSPADLAAVEEIAENLDFRIVTLETNAGYGAAANAGIARAYELGCQVIIVVNPDVTLDEPALLAIDQACQENHQAIFSPTVLDDQGRRWGSRGSVDTTSGRLWTYGDHGSNVWWISGACVAAHRETWTSLGGFDDDYFMYWEDVDLSYRAQQFGYGVELLNDVGVRHAVGGTQEQATGKSALYVEHNCRGRLVFAGKHLGVGRRLRWLAGTPADVRRVLSRGNNPTRADKFRMIGPAILGCVRGLPWLIAPRAAARIRTLRARRD